MFSFFRRKDKKSPVPEWADYFTQEEWDAFLAAVHTYFKAKGDPYTIGDGVVETAWGSKSGKPQELGLTNVSQMCKQSTPDDYVRVVQNHFETMRKSQEFIGEFFERINDFDFVAPFIGARLYHKDHVASIGAANVLYKPVTEEIIAMLVLDMPQAVSSVKPEQVQVWGRSSEELFALGLQNIFENYDFEVMELDAGIPLKAIVQDHFFGANILLDLAHHPELLGTHGTLVGVPHRHTTLFFPIEDTSFIQAINMMIPMIHGMHHEGPGSISNCLYWYRAGAFEKLPYEISPEQTIQFYPTEGLAALIEYMSLES
jgi:hypothetical protein